MMTADGKTEEEEARASARALVFVSLWSLLLLGLITWWVW